MRATLIVDSLRTRFSILFTVGCLVVGVLESARGDVKLPSIFGEHMVLQQGQQNPLWGIAEPGETVTVTLGDQARSVIAAADGRWHVVLDSLPAGGPHQLEVRGTNVIRREDVLVGEVWICSGDSIMEFPVERIREADLEVPAANFPRIRMISVPHQGSQQPRDDFEGEWQVCSPATVSEFSAVGYLFARQLHHTLNVPIGLIDNAWGDSTCEAWIRPDLLAADTRYAPLLAHWSELQKNSERDAVAALREGRGTPPPPEEADKGKGKRRGGRRGGQRGTPAAAPPADPLTGPRRPGNLYYGVLRPTLGYGIRGVIWHQGESNAERAQQYRDLFPLLVKDWREEWGQGEFPFYWVQLAASGSNSTSTSDSARAELREAQTMVAAKIPNTGQVVITDLGEASTIHPNHTQDVARRLVRWALAREYGVVTPYESPRYQSHQRVGNRMVIRFGNQRDRNGALRTLDGSGPTGFVIAGEDRKFVPAQARIAGGTRIEVWSDDVPEPVAVRYAWSDQATGNLQSRGNLPLTPFRTDDWTGVTADVHK